MRLERIYASRLYVTSTRKDRIHAAMQDPINAELVQQLEEYLDDKSKLELKQARKSIKDKEQAEVAKQEDNAVSPSDGGSTSAPSGGAPHHPFTGDIMSDFGEDDLADAEIPDDMGGGEDAPAEPEEPEAVESVTQEGRPITSSTAVIWTTLDDVSKECETIKGTLNAREDTCGVNRLEVKDMELWIYFNDDVNLNDTMVEVISVLNSIGYTYLKFNRLARSNNAIVFDILLNDKGQIKTVKEIKEENK